MRGGTVVKMRYTQLSMYSRENDKISRIEMPNLGWTANGRAITRQEKGTTGGRGLLRHTLSNVLTVLRSKKGAPVCRYDMLSTSLRSNGLMRSVSARLAYRTISFLYYFSRTGKAQNWYSRLALICLYSMCTACREKSERHATRFTGRVRARR